MYKTLGIRPFLNTKLNNFIILLKITRRYDDNNFGTIFINFAYSTRRGGYTKTRCCVDERRIGTHENTQQYCTHRFFTRTAVTKIIIKCVYVQCTHNRPLTVDMTYMYLFYPKYNCRPQHSPPRWKLKFSTVFNFFIF